MDIENLRKLKELKEKGLLSQEEFDKQISNFLDSSNENAERHKIQIQLNIKPLIYLIVICLGIYIGGIYTFSVVVTHSCHKNVSADACECVKKSILKNTTFVDKMKILLTDASYKEIAEYLDFGDTLRCAIAQAFENKD